MPIRVIERKNINADAWNECIAQSDFPAVYATVSYLDFFAQDWEALVEDDYARVMPLPFRRKWSFTYTFQPFLCPMLGLFGKNISTALITDFLHSIPKRYKLWDLSFNPSNVVDAHFKTQFRRLNHVLLLHKSYEEISNNYSENIRRNLEKAEKSGCRLELEIPIAEVIDICEEQWPGFTKVDHEAFARLRENAAALDQKIETYGVYDANGLLVSVAAFLFYGKRVYYWLAGNRAEARELGSSALLIDGLIRKYAGKDLVLDFEGSDVGSVAEFYKKFGAVEEYYTSLYENLLPFPVSLMKRMPAYYKDLWRAK